MHLKTISRCAKLRNGHIQKFNPERHALSLLTRFQDGMWPTDLLKSLNLISISLRRGIITATSIGQFTLNTTEGETTCSRFLAPNLKDLRVSHSGASFSTGGDEVELSTWDLEASLAATSIDDNPAEPQPPSKKRKKDDPLQAGETWRAKNVSCSVLPLSLAQYSYPISRLIPGTVRQSQPTSPRTHHIPLLRRQWNCATRSGDRDKLWNHSSI